jgi:hypothetical protein
MTFKADIQIAYEVKKRCIQEIAAKLLFCINDEGQIDGLI